MFQDPFSSLDPSQTIGDAVAEPLRIAEPRLPASERTERVAAMLAKVGISRSALTKYPAEFSGGQRQRIAIARALVLEPRIVVCDEAVSALDVSVQAQVLNLLEQLQREVGTSYVFISHNMAVVRHISDRVVVLYRGRVMEEGTAADVCDRPAHPYNALAARRRARSRRRRAASAPRCPHRVERAVRDRAEGRGGVSLRPAVSVRPGELRAEYPCAGGLGRAARGLRENR